MLCEIDLNLRAIQKSMVSSAGEPFLQFQGKHRTCVLSLNTERGLGNKFDNITFDVWTDVFTDR